MGHLLNCCPCGNHRTLLGFLGGSAMSAQSSQGRVVVARISTRGETVCRALLVESSFSARCNYYSYFLESPNAITHAFFMIKYFVLCARQAVERSLRIGVLRLPTLCCSGNTTYIGLHPHNIG